MKLSPSTLFVLAAIALASGVGLVATRTASGGDLETKLPSDARSFGFVSLEGARSHAGGVPLLEATRPFSLALSNGSVHAEPPNAARLNWAAAVTQRELARYPSIFLRRVRLAGIVLTSDLSEGEMPIPSLPNVGGLMLLDTTSEESDFVRSLHHEIFHFFDLADGQLAGGSPDAKWEALNSSGFRYGSGGRTLRGAWASKPSRDIPGFVSAYATSGVEEDKAETFAFVVARRSLMKEACAADHMLQAKVDELARRLNLLEPSTSTALGF